MESIDKGLKVCTKMGADKLFENAPKIYLPKLSAQVQKFGILMKKGFIGCQQSVFFPNQHQCLLDSFKIGWNSSGDLILESFSLWLKSPKTGAKDHPGHYLQKRENSQDSDLVHFLGDLSQMKNFLRLSLFSRFQRPSKIARTLEVRQYVRFCFFLFLKLNIF